MFTQEEFKRISREVSDKYKEEFTKYIEIFNSYYSIEALEKIDGLDLAIRLFASKDYVNDHPGMYPSISNWAEFGIHGMSLYGKGKSGAYHGVRYDDNKFIYYDYYVNGKVVKSPNIFTLKEDEAINIARNIREILNSVCKIAQPYYFQTVKDYEKFETELKDYLKDQMKNFWWNDKGEADGVLLKYIATSFYQKFSFSFSNYATNCVLLKFLDDNEKLPKTKITKNGLIRLKAIKMGITTWAFENTCVQMNVYEDDIPMLLLIKECLKEHKECMLEELYKYVKESRKNSSVIANSNWKENIKNELDQHVEGSDEPIFAKKDEKYSLLPIAALENKDDIKPIENEEDGEEVKIEETGYNALYYGISGCGKSHKVHKLIKDGGYKEIRTVFFSDYSYNDFVGHIEPYKDGANMDYRIKAGPFLLALTDALKSPKEKIALVIEEINRGDAPAILGDIFQLLDREDDIKIVSPIMSDYLKQVLKKDFNEINLPKNLYIFATMNTSDQNVNKLDAAFKRRWKMIRITNKDARSDLITKNRNFNIPGFDSKLTWDDFVIAINKRIIESNLEEDRQLGYWFYNNKGNVTALDFANKVLEYLWNDVLRYSDKSIIFNKKYKTFDDVINDFISNDPDICKNVFAYNLFDIEK